MEPDRQKSAIRLNRVSLLFIVVFVAIAGVCVLAGVNSARESSRRSVCQNNIRNVSTALLNYVDARNQYPGYANVVTMADKTVYRDARTGMKTGVGWVLLILRHLDRPNSDTTPKTPADKVPRTVAAAKHGQPELKGLICPVDPRVGSGDLALSYVVNCGMKDWTGSATVPRDWQENGVFFDRFTGDKRVAVDEAGQIPIVTMSNAFIARGDGLQNTMLLTENVDAGNYMDADEARVGVLWCPKGTVDLSKDPPNLSPPDENMRINHGRGTARGAADVAAFARPSSNHPGGVNMVFCDGHVKFVSDQIDYWVYCSLMSTNGSRVRETGSDVIVPGFGPVLGDGWPY
jgi:prepilin-type processing-associated H-X9-DG protein